MARERLRPDEPGRLVHGIALTTVVLFFCYSVSALESEGKV